MNRKEEVRRYLRLFGYKSERTILQVHIAGSFGRGRPAPAEVRRRATGAIRYGWYTFTVVGGATLPDLEESHLWRRDVMNRIRDTLGTSMVKRTGTGSRPTNCCGI